MRSPKRTRKRDPVTPFCWRLHAPASINSAATNIAENVSNRSSKRYRKRVDMAQRLRTDWILFITVVCMVSFGVLILYSASSVMAELKFGSIWHFVLRQVAWAVVAILAMMTLKKTNYRKFHSPAV